jgi:hypothetical protein
MELPKSILPGLLRQPRFSSDALSRSGAAFELLGFARARTRRAFRLKTERPTK